MSRRQFFQVLVTAVVCVCLLVFPGRSSAQGRSEEAFERVKEVQERHTEALMAKEGVVGTAVGLDDAGSHAVFVLLERPGVAGIPQELDGVRVRAIVTGEIRALAKPLAKPGRDRKPPAVPTGLTATAQSSSEIDLAWVANTTDSDFASYRVFRATASGGPYTRIASGVTDTTYSSTGLTADKTYYYVVTAVDTSGNESAYSEPASAKTLPGTVGSSPYPRPARIGVSTGHPNITAGTIGCRVKDSSGNVYALSNNHVYADENRAGLGDNALQPGPYDGGLNPRDKIGTLHDFEPIVFSRRADNVIDAAIALCSTATLDNRTPDNGYGIPSSTLATDVAVGLTVMKYGRTTGLQSGQIYLLNATVNVGYDSGTARFINQIVITPGTFSAGGDSGSLIVTQTGKKPVGLLFAGSSSYTIANPIGPVLTRFGVDIDGQ